MNKLSRYTMESNSFRAKERCEELLSLADSIKNDDERKERLSVHECMCCYYIGKGRIGCAAMTTHNCELCNKEQIYGSTNYDVICLDCAKINKLCRHCGGDINMKSSRRKWPE